MPVRAWRNPAAVWASNTSTSTTASAPGQWRLREVMRTRPRPCWGMRPSITEWSATSSKTTSQRRSVCSSHSRTRAALAAGSSPGVRPRRVPRPAKPAWAKAVGERASSPPALAQFTHHTTSRRCLAR